jgi:hypothetical protein
MRDARKWAKKHKPKPEPPDPLDEYLADNYPPAPEGVPGGYIVVGPDDIYPDDPRWPGDEIAREIAALYQRLLCGPGKPKPNRYERFAAELLAKGQRRRAKRRQRYEDDE